VAEPLTPETRLPLNIAGAKATVDATLKLLAQLSEGRQQEPAWKEAAAAARTLHLDIAAAEFDARLPGRAARPGNQAIEALVAREER
jgi:hypothetical protein